MLLGIFGIWKRHVKDSKSCIVTFCYCLFTGVFKKLRASLGTNLGTNWELIFNEPSSQGWQNALYQGGDKLKIETRIPDTGFEESHKSPNSTPDKVRKSLGPIWYPLPSAGKNNLPVMSVDTSANDKIELVFLKTLFFILQVILFKCK